MAQRIFPPTVRSPLMWLRSGRDRIAVKEEPRALASGIFARIGPLRALYGRWTTGQGIGDRLRDSVGTILGLRTGRRAGKPAGREGRHPWESAYPKGIDWHSEIPRRPLFDLLDESVARFPEHRCLDFLGKTYSYRDVGDLVNRAAKGFQMLGVEKGTRVALLLPNTPYYVICFFAVLKAGGVVVNFNPLHAKREIAGRVKDSGAEILVALNLHASYPKVAGLLDGGPLKRIVVCRMNRILPFPRSALYPLFRRKEIAAIPADERHVWFETLVANDGRYRRVDVDPLADLALLQYTGGVDGRIKGAMLTHGNLFANAAQNATWFAHATSGGERTLGVLPLCHVFALTAVMNVGLRLGAEIVLLPRFEAEAAVEAIARKKITSFLGVPAMFAALARLRGARRPDLSSLTLCVCGGAPLSAEVRARFEGLTGRAILEGYGLTECTAVATCHPFAGPHKPGSVGLPLPGTVVEIASPDDPDRLLPPGEAGEVVVSGPQVMAGYWRQPGETGEVLRDGRLSTGDLGYLDEEGYLYLTGHRKDLILVGGYNVYPRAVEEAVALHGAVEGVRVAGARDPLRGEVVTAAVKLRPGERVSAQDLRVFLEDKLAHYEIPRKIEFVDELPARPEDRPRGRVVRPRWGWPPWFRRKPGGREAA